MLRCKEKRLTPYPETGSKEGNIVRGFASLPTSFAKIVLEADSASNFLRPLLYGLHLRQYFINFSGQHLHAERFLNELHILIKDAPQTHHIRSVARHI